MSARFFLFFTTTSLYNLRWTMPNSRVHPTCRVGSIELPGQSRHAVVRCLHSGSQRRKRITFKDKPKGEPIVAPALACRFGAVTEDMALMASAADAVIFPSGQYQLEVRLCGDVTWNSLYEAWPAGSTLEFGIRNEKWQPTRGADERTSAFLVVERIGKRALRAFFEEDCKLIRGQELTPFRLRFVELGNRLRI